jgi:hypothetical protein
MKSAEWQGEDLYIYIYIKKNLSDFKQNKPLTTEPTHTWPASHRLGTKHTKQI